MGRVAAVQAGEKVKRFGASCSGEKEREQVYGYGS